MNLLSMGVLITKGYQFMLVSPKHLDMPELDCAIGVRELRVTLHTRTTLAPCRKGDGGTARSA